MDLAVKLSSDNIDNGGGPFGAVIVKDGQVLATGVNRVTASCDPTAHAEVSAIRAACAKIKDFRLSDCIIYSSCEPCPMCLSSIYWAGIKKVYFGNTKEDAAAINFSDKFIYDELALPLDRRHLPAIHVDNTGAIKAFEKWASSSDKIEY
ncbi:MAG: nucleoside deaminase [Muribaculum sp.]|nr:nucleoside deaminase [Muribaculum sp.]